MLARPVRPSGGMVVVRAMETYGMPRSEVSRVAVSPRFPQRGGQAVEQGPQGLGPRGGSGVAPLGVHRLHGGPGLPGEREIVVGQALPLGGGVQRVEQRGGLVQGQFGVDGLAGVADLRVDLLPGGHRGMTTVVAAPAGWWLSREIRHSCP